MSDLNKWALRHGVNYAALEELRRMMGATNTDPDAELGGTSEAAIQTSVRLQATRDGARLWRNNVGACVDDNGNFIRYGIANDNKKINSVFKSSDLIGIKPVTITPDMVGSTIGQFMAREVKAGNWRYSGNAHELAQLRFIEFIVGMGGDAKFINSID